MKFVLIKDRVLLKGSKNINSGSINYYEIPIEIDTSWNDLVIKAVMTKKGEDFGEEVAVIDNRFYIDREKSGEYKIGFVGYTIENDEKTLQISTNLLSINIEPGAGEINILDTHEIPTPSEWEVYLAQIQEITGTINGLSASLTEQVEAVEAALESGELNGEDGKDGITPTIGENGNWYIGDEDTGKPSRGEPGYELTQEDKEEITQMVLAEFPDGDEVSY